MINPRSQRAILVVDDEEVFALALHEFFASQNYRVLTARDGNTALQMLEKERIDLVLSDVIMPGMKGTELLRDIRMSTPDMPVIMLTGQPNVDTAVVCMKNGAVDFLTKPVCFPKLLELVQHTLSRPRQSAVLPVPGVEPTRKLSVHKDETQEIPGGPALPTIAGYQIDRRLGQGQFGTVYLAEKDARKVALKTLKIADDADPQSSQIALKRFVREAKMVGQVQHPNIVKIHEFGITDKAEVPFIAYEYVPGTSMRLLMRRTELSMEERLALIRQTATGLSAIHAEDIIHRDIKPENLLVSEELVLKIADFGIGRWGTSNLTSDTWTVGTPGYMAPELLQTSKIDHRGDLFSLGVVAYELLVGLQPFKGRDLLTTLTNTKTQMPTEPRKLDPNFPKDLQLILGRMLSKSVRDRYQSAGEFITDLDDFLRHGTVRNRLLRFLNRSLGTSTWS